MADVRGRPWAGSTAAAVLAGRPRSEANEHLVSLAEWVQSNRLLRQFLIRFSDQLWGDVAKDLCLLGVLCLRHLSPSPDTAWSSGDLSDLVEYIQREGRWPEELTPVSGEREDWLPPWEQKRTVFSKPSPEWRTVSPGPTPTPPAAATSRCPQSPAEWSQTQFSSTRQPPFEVIASYPPWNRPASPGREQVSTEVFKSERPATRVVSRVGGAQLGGKDLPSRSSSSRATRDGCARSTAFHAELRPGSRNLGRRASGTRSTDAPAGVSSRATESVSSRARGGPVKQGPSLRAACDAQRQDRERVGAASALNAPPSAWSYDFAPSWRAAPTPTEAPGRRLASSGWKEAEKHAVHRGSDLLTSDAAELNDAHPVPPELASGVGTLDSAGSELADRVDSVQGKLRVTQMRDAGDDALSTATGAIRPGGSISANDQRQDCRNWPMFRAPRHSRGGWAAEVDICNDEVTAADHSPEDFPRIPLSSEAAALLALRGSQAPESQAGLRQEFLLHQQRSGAAAYSEARSPMLASPESNTSSASSGLSLGAPWAQSVGGLGAALWAVQS
ncbi:unnamed protein product [Polarella glacialis]|uniref:Uncharacterized protein n=1 Tax=Polarella glacialis TaxID=89957 RepID=A0A813E3K8_POLGL|nr:unnamed protein product [Polarella glacialis]